MEFYVMSLFVIPALFALIAKILIIFVYRQNIRSAIYFKALLIIFALHNLCEVLAFWEFFRGMNGEFLLKTYYVISLVSLFTIVLAVLDIHGEDHRTRIALLGCLIMATSGLILFTDLIVAGATNISYVITAERGLFYGVFQIVSLLMISNVVYMIYKGYKQSENHEVQIRSAYMGVALIPHAISVVLVIALMNLGFQINAAVIFPIATTLFVFIILASEKEHQMTDVRRFIPFSDERRTSNQILDIFSEYSQDKASYREAISSIEKLLVEHKYEKNNRNATNAADRMGMPRSSLYSLFNRLNITKD